MFSSVSFSGLSPFAFRQIPENSFNQNVRLPGITSLVPPTVLEMINKELTTNNEMQYGLRISSQSLPALFLRQYEILPLPEGEEFSTSKEILREYIQANLQYKVPFKDALLYLSLLVKISEESPNLGERIQELVFSILKDHPKKLLDLINHIELHPITLEKRQELRNAARNYYQIAFQYLIQIFNNLSPSVKKNFEDLFFISAASETSGIEMNPLIVFLYADKYQLQELQSFKNASGGRICIHTMFNAVGNPFFGSTFSFPISAKGREMLTYFSHFTKIPPFEFFQYAKVHPFFKSFLQEYLKNLIKPSFRFTTEEMMLYSDFANEYPLISEAIIRSLNNSSSSLFISVPFLNLRTLSIKDFQEKDRPLIGKLIKNFDFKRAELSFDAFEKLKEDKIWDVLKATIIIAIEMPKEYFSVNGNEELKRLFLSKSLESNECILPEIDDSVYDVPFIHSLFKRPLTTLNFTRVKVDEKIFKISLSNEIRVIIIPSDNTLSSLLLLKDLQNLNEIFFQEFDNSLDYQKNIKNFEMLGKLLFARNEANLPKISSYCSFQLLSNFISDPIFFKEFESNLHLLNCLINLHELKPDTVKEFLNKLSSAQYLKVLHLPYLAVLWFPFHIEKLILQDGQLWEILVNSLLACKDRFEFASYSNYYTPEKLDYLFKLLQTQPKLLESGYSFWIKFVEQFLIPQGFLDDLAAFIIQKIDKKEEMQQKRITKSLNTHEYCPSEKFLQAIFLMPWIKENPKIALELLVKFSFHAAFKKEFLNPVQESLQENVWETLCLASQNNCSAKSLTLSFISISKVDSLIGYPSLIAAYPAIAAAALYRLMLGLNQDNESQNNQLLCLFNLVIKNAAASGFFTHLLATVTPSISLDGKRLILLYQELNKISRGQIVDYEELVINLLHTAPYSNNYSKMLVDEWYKLFVLVTKKNILSKFNSNFFSSYPPFSKQIGTKVALESNELFFKYFSPYITSFFLGLCQAELEEQELEKYLDFFVTKGWLPPCEEPFDSYLFVLKKIETYLVSIKNAFSPLQKAWAEAIIMLPFGGSLVKEEQDICLTLMSHPNLQSFYPDAIGEECLKLGKNPDIFRKWLEICLANLSSQNYDFALHLCAATLELHKKKGLKSEEFYEECLNFVMKIFETTIRKEDLLEKDVDQHLNVFKSCLGRDQALIDRLLRKCFNSNKLDYPALVAILLSLKFSLPVNIPAVELRFLAFAYQKVCLCEGSSSRANPLFRVQENKNLFDIFLIEEICRAKVPLSNYPQVVQLCLLQNFTDLVLKNVKNIQDSNAETYWKELCDWFVDELILSCSVAQKLWISMQKGIKHPIIKKIVHKIIYEVNLRHKKDTLSVSNIFAFHLLFTILHLKTLDIETQKACLILWNLAGYERMRIRLLDYLPVEACHLNQNILVFFKERPDLCVPMANQLPLLILKVLGGDWLRNQKELLKELNILYPKCLIDIFIPLCSAFSAEDIEFILDRKLTEIERRYNGDWKFSIDRSSFLTAKTLTKKTIPLSDDCIEPPFLNVEYGLETIFQLDYNPIKSYVKKIETKSLVIESELALSEISAFYEEYLRKIKKLLTAAHLLSKDKFLELAVSLAQESEEKKTIAEHFAMLHYWYQRVSIAWMIACFDQLNFTNSFKSDFIPPEELIVDGENVTPEVLRFHLQQLASNLIFKEKFTAVPAEEEQANVFFAEMTNCLRHIVKHILSKKPAEVSTCLLELCNIGGQCAAAYQEGLPLLCCNILEIVNKSLVSSSLQNKLSHLLHQSRWKWYHNQISDLELNINTAQYFQQKLEEPLGLYRPSSTESRTNSAFVISNSRIIIERIKFLFQWMYNPSSIVNLIDVAVNGERKVLNIEEISDWFKKHVPQGMAQDTVLSEVFDEEGKLKRTWIIYFLEQEKILRERVLLTSE